VPWLGHTCGECSYCQRLANRVARIEQRKHDASDATRHVAVKQQSFAIGAMDWHIVDAGGVPGHTLRRARAFTAGSAPDDVR
jgi:predicted kinase